jgi:hypothetical protein
LDSEVVEMIVDSVYVVDVSAVLVLWVSLLALAELVTQGMAVIIVEGLVARVVEAHARQGEVGDGVCLVHDSPEGAVREIVINKVCESLVAGAWAAIVVNLHGVRRLNV